MGLLIGLAGIILSSRLVGVRPTEGYRYLIVVLTAVLLSGVRLTGGTGSLFHVLVAVVLLGVVDNSMVLLAVEYKYQQMIRGCIFLGAVVYNNVVDNYLVSFRYLKE
jgi:ribose/xylose/arabinose/galactoside ABC-type transport system permease subunit